MKFLFFVTLFVLVTATTRATAAADETPILRKTSVAGALDEPEKDPIREETKTTSSNNSNNGGGGGVRGKLDEPKKGGARGKMDDPGEINTETGEMEEPHSHAAMMTTVRVRARDVSGKGGTATFSLYVYDRQLADDSVAYEVIKKSVTVPANNDVIITSLSFDKSKKLQGSGRTWFKMSTPAMYLTLIREESDLRPGGNQDEFVMNIQPGERVTYKLRQKKHSE